MQHLLRCLFFIAAAYSVTVHAVNILGGDNGGEDAISRNNIQQFFHLHPQANPLSTPLPQDLVDLLIRIQLEWMSSTWRRLFKGSLQQDWRSPQGRRTNQEAVPTSHSVLVTTGQPSQRLKEI